MKINIDELKLKMIPRESTIMESGLSRINQWVKSKDIACITAIRSNLRNVTSNTFMDIGVEEKYTKEQNEIRNNMLRARLLKLGYGVTNIIGSYKNDNTNEDENSFFVVNLKDDPNFFLNIFKLSEYFNQDSFLFKNANDSDAYLIGTNHDSFVGYGEIKKQGPFHSSVNANFMSKIRNGGFTFSDNTSNKIKKEYNKSNFKGRKKQQSELNETPMGIETFEQLSLSGKYLCDTYDAFVGKL
jgi:hypothetical protein